MPPICVHDARNFPGKFLAWTSLSEPSKDNEAAQDPAQGIRKGARADPTASGSTLFGGNLILKTKFVP